MKTTVKGTPAQKATLGTSIVWGEYGYGGNKWIGLHIVDDEGTLLTTLLYMNDGELVAAGGVDIGYAATHDVSLDEDGTMHVGNDSWM